MASATILWLHALVALLFGGAALVQLRARRAAVPVALLVAASGLTALWALAVAGIGDRDPGTLLAQGLRNLVWLGVVAALAARTGPSRSRDASFVAAGLCLALGMVLAVLAGAIPVLAIERAALALRMLGLTAGFVLLYRVRRDLGGGAGVLLAGAVALIWLADLGATLVAYLGESWPAGLLIARGVAIGTAAPVLLAAALQRDAPLSPSRSIASRGLLGLLGLVYLVATALAIGWIGRIGGDHARLAQTAFVVGTAVALATLASSPWLRAWAKVMVAKHLFRHRYDYRAEWLRFTQTLARPEAGGPSLAQRVVRAMADLTASPAALLLVRDGDALHPGTAWEWAPGEASGGEFVRHLEDSTRILDLDQIRAGGSPSAETAATPVWLLAREDAWALVPLIHGDRLVGAVALARPPVDRALDWEDFDLLGVAGRQAASHLAEERAHAELAEARRFEEFNRRFAFIGHDLKNLVSQLALVARNAERHADNPAFRADMVATLAESSQRMTTLLQRLSQHGVASAEPARPVPLLALLERIADARRAQHPVRASGDALALALVDAAALETAIGHLLQNAIEASGAGAPVHLTATRVADGVAVEVIDRGSGMSPDFVRDDLFRPFASAKTGGFGLGAHEARTLVTAMGGQLAVTSREGEGTVFRIELPAAAALEAAA